MSINKCILRFVLLLTGLFFLPCLARAQTTPPSPGAAQPSLLGTPEIIVEHGKGTGKALINLRNNSNATMAVSLNGVITLSAKPSGARIAFAPEKDPDNGSEVLDFAIPTQGTVKLWATVTGVWEAGDLEAEIRNKNTATGDKIRIKSFPFSIKLGGPDPEKAELSLVKDQIATVIIKNEDPIPYPLSWRLRIDGRDVCGNNLTIDRNSMALLECKPSLSFSPSRISNLFKSEASEGNQLLLYPQVSSADLSGVSPWKSFPVKANLNYFGLFTQQVASYVVIVLALILGGLTSLFLSQALPNRIKRLNIQDQLDSLARSTAEFSSKIDSKLQVMTRMERSQLRELLRSRNTFSPDFSSIVTECAQRIASLSSRVALIQQMDLVFGRLAEAVRHGAPPSKIDAIEADLKNAKVLLTKTQPTDDEIKAAQAAITQASTRVDTINQEDADFGQKLAQRVADIKTSIAGLLTTASFVRIIGNVPGPYQNLQQIATATTPVTPASYSSVDMATEKMILIRDYAQLVEGTANPDAKARLAEWEDKLVEFLQPESWSALVSARLLLREMKDDIYPGRLHDALVANPQEASIGVDPSYAYDQAALEFCVGFNSQAVDDAAAREEWSCSWDFGDGLGESGWNVFHYFMLKPDRFGRKEQHVFEVKATFKDAEGKQILNSNSEPVLVSKPVKVVPSILGNLGERSWTEALKLSAALLIAVFGLVAGAREQLLKLDVLPGLIAVFLVGFGADTIKNLLTTKA